jgi:hypothetical protein
MNGDRILTEMKSLHSDCLRYEYRSIEILRTGCYGKRRDKYIKFGDAVE